jgi:hypothetical protein
LKEEEIEKKDLRRRVEGGRDRKEGLWSRVEGERDRKEGSKDESRRGKR